MGHKVGDKVTHPIPQSAALFGVGLQVKMFPGFEIIQRGPVWAPDFLFLPKKVFVIPYYMATFARSAPLLESRTLVEGAQFQEIVQRSRSLTQKILLSIPDTHKACVYTETLLLDSPEIARFAIMASNIGIPSAPVLRVVSEDFTLETSLRRMHEGLQLHRALLNAISPRLERKKKVTVSPSTPPTDKVAGLVADIKDLVNQINKMLKLVQVEPTVQPSPTPVALRLPGEYEVQVAAHLTLVQLQSFGQDVDRCLRSLELSTEDEAES